MKELKAAGVAVVLGSASKNAPPILKSLGIQELFDAVVDGNMVQEAKPDPQVHLFFIFPVSSASSVSSVVK